MQYMTIRTLGKHLDWEKQFLENVMKEESEIMAPVKKTKFHQAGGGRKLNIFDVRQAIYDWFIDV